VWLAVLVIALAGLACGGDGQDDPAKKAEKFYNENGYAGVEDCEEKARRRGQTIFLCTYRPPPEAGGGSEAEPELKCFLEPRGDVSALDLEVSCGRQPLGR
jgi:hypothetical protein